jgi:PAS domain S-box-containing protein
MKVRTKLIMGFSAAIVLLWLVVIYAISNMADLKEHFVAVENDIIPNTIEIEEIARAADVAYQSTMDYVLRYLSESKESAESRIQELEQVSNKYLPLTEGINSDEYSENQKLQVLIQTLTLNLTNIIDLKEQGISHNELLALDRNTSLPALINLEQSINERKADGIVQLTAISEDYKQAHFSGVHWLLVSAGLFTVLVVVAAYLTTRSIVRPLHVLHKGTEMIAQGRLDYKVGTKASDEIGQLSRAFDQMTTSLNQSMTSIDVLNKEITERTKAEEALRKSEERYRDLFDNASELIQSIDPQGKFVYANKAWHDSLEYDESEMADLTFMDIIHPDYLEHCENIFQRMMAGEAIPRVEAVFVSKNGNLIQVQGDVTAQYENNEIVATRGIFHDVTESKKAAEALQESEEKFSIAFHSNPNAMCISRIEDGVFIEVNESFTRDNGYTRDEAIGHSSAELNIWVNSNDRKRIMEKLKKEGKVLEEEYLARTKSGKIRNMLFSAGRINVAGQDCLIGVSTDITERRQAEEDLRESQEFNTSLLENAPHQIVVINPDTSIRYVNPKFEEVNGWTLDEIVGIKAPYPWWTDELKTEEAIEQFKEAIRMDVGQVETMARKKNGELYWLDLNWVGVKHNDELQYCLINSNDITELKRAEQALKESEEKFSKAFRSSPNIVAISTLKEGRFIEVNDSFTGLTGYTREELIGHSAKEIHIWENPKDRDEMLRILKKYGRVHNHEFNFRIKSGEIRIWSFSADLIDIGTEPCMISMTIDITELKRAEQALKESEEKFSKAFRSSPNTIVITTLKEGRFIEVNDSFTDLTGYTREEVIGNTAIDFNLWADPEDRDRMLRILKRDGRVHNHEFNFRVKSGEIRTWTFSAELIDIGPEPCMISMTMDITEQKRAQETIKESEEKFSKAFHSSPAAISISLLSDGSFIEINNSYTQITGYTRKELIGHNAEEYNMWAKAEQKDSMVNKMQNREKMNNEEYEFRSKSGKIKTMLVSSEYLTLGGKPCVLVASTDITERKKTEEKLKETLKDLEHSSAQLAATNKELETFSYSVSHDLRSPLRSIDGFSQALLEDYEDSLDEIGKDYLNRLRTASQKMGELIDGLLKLSRLTRGQMHQEEVDLSTLVEEITSRLHENEPKRKVDFIIRKGLVAQGDRELLRALFENLLGNAWKFTSKSEKARIEFGITKNGKKTTYFINDNGAGFDMVYADKLFGAFQRLHDASEFAGTGIGLATVLRIINRHGGNIWAEGAVNKGATFYFTLN